jgi:metal-responsive CopG/Arc/MetJ family transcriptional regulator
MEKLEILLDEESGRVLDSLAEQHSGDRNEAIRDALRMHGTLEGLLDQVEEIHATELLAQRERSERGFREGRFTPWEALEKKLGL